MSNNNVFGTSWWTYGATSGIVFADSIGTGTNTMSGNVVYANRNFLHVFVTQVQDHGGSNVENYGLWNQNKIVDSSGVILTRNSAYEGTFILKDNIAFDNGINGLVVHKTTHESATSIV